MLITFIISSFFFQFALLMSEAILAFTSSSPLSKGFSHSSRLTLHWVLQILAVSSITVAFLSIYYTKENYKKEHFVSTHASLGLTTCLLGGGVIAGGIAARFGFLLKSVINPILLKSIHASGGIATYLLAITTICYGLQTDWFREKSHSDTITTTVTLTALIGLAVVAKPIWTIFSRLGGLIKTKST